MNAADVMVREVITIGPDATIRDVAGLLLKNRISALPVVDAEGKLVGIVSEGDLLHRAEAGTQRRHSWWLAVFSSKESLADEFVKSHARTVADIMTRKVVTASPDISVRDIAALLEKNGIKRVPIVKDGKLVGIVSRANLIQALASVPVQPAKSVDDKTLREQIMANISAKSWARPSLINALVHDGTVELWGVTASESEKNALRVVAEITPGVRTVKDNLTVRPVESWA
ncbi:MAG: CBS domain-containing protein [Xanthobacteraceae bacterium]